MTHRSIPTSSNNAARGKNKKNESKSSNFRSENGTLNEASTSKNSTITKNNYLSVQNNLPQNSSHPSTVKPNKNDKIDEKYLNFKKGQMRDILDLVYDFDVEEGGLEITLPRPGGLRKYKQMGIQTTGK